MLVDGGAVMNVMPISTFSKIRQSPEDLIKRNMVMKDLEGNTS
jgi:hypothetical protein